MRGEQARFCVQPVGISLQLGPFMREERSTERSLCSCHISATGLLFLLRNGPVNQMFWECMPSVVSKLLIFIKK